MTTKPQEVLGNPPAPPHTLQKEPNFWFWTKIQMAPNSNIWRYIQIYSAQNQTSGAKIQTFDPKFKWIYFYTIKNLPVCTRKTPNPTLPACHPPTPSSVLVKNEHAYPLKKGKKRKKKRQRKWEGCDKVLPKVKPCWSRPKKVCIEVSRRKERKTVVCERKSPEDQNRPGRGRCLWNGELGS